LTKIVCFSDTHGQHNSRKLNDWFADNPGDILIFAGDFQRNHFDDGSDFVKWLVTLPYAHKVVAFGNHDGNGSMIKDELLGISNVHILHNGSIIINGIKIFGSPNSLIFFNWYFMKTEEELEEIYKNIPDDTNIVITHTPAFGIWDNTTRGIYAGSKSLLNRINELDQMKFHVCGHIHEGHGKGSFGNKIFINASLLNEKYQLVNMPYIFEYKRRKRKSSSNKSLDNI